MSIPQYIDILFAIFLTTVVPLVVILLIVTVVAIIKDL